MHWPLFKGGKYWRACREAHPEKALPLGLSKMDLKRGVIRVFKLFSAVFRREKVLKALFFHLVDQNAIIAPTVCFPSRFFLKEKGTASIGASLLGTLMVLWLAGGSFYLSI